MEKLLRVSVFARCKFHSQDCDCEVHQELRATRRSRAQDKEKTKKLIEEHLNG